jgi:O-antigen ligase
MIGSLAYAITGLYLALAITTLHLQINLLERLPLENGLVVIATALMLYDIARQRVVPRQDSLLWPLCFILGGLILLPLVSSVYNHSDFWIWRDGEYRSLIKIVLISLVGVYFLDREPLQLSKFLRFFISMYGAFAILIFFRLYWLQEVRPFDLRPELNLRHGDANFLATFFVMVLPLSWLAFNLEKRLVWKVWLGSCVVLFIGILIVMQSRMVILAFALGGLPILFTLKKNQRIILLGLSSVTLLLFLAGGASERFMAMGDKSNVDRVKTYHNGAQLFLKSPLIGVGMHQAVHTHYQYGGYPAMQSEEGPLDIHNTFLKNLAELGILGAIFLALLWLLSLKQLITLRDNPLIKAALLSSLTMLFLSTMTVGISYKDLFIFHLVFLAATPLLKVGEHS